MSDEDDLQESEGEYEHIKVPKEKWKDGAPLHVEAEDELLENQQIYTPLRLVIKKKDGSDRRFIPATLYDRLAFIRAYCTTPSKSWFPCWRDDVVHQVIYIAIVFNSVFLCIAIFFIQSFLGVYASDHHLFLTKMVPLSYGIIVMYLFSSILELTLYTDICGTYLDYFIVGILYRFPWSTCPRAQRNKRQLVPFGNKTYIYRCQSFKNFKAFTKNATSAYRVAGGVGVNNCYISHETGTCNQLTTMTYFGHRGYYIDNNPLIVFMYFMIIWAACLAWHKQIYRRILFKALNISQVMFALGYLVVMLHIKLLPEVGSVPPKPVIELDVDQRAFDLFSDLTQLIISNISFTPPFLHLLAARCKEVKPSSESIFMALGNIGFLFFRTWVDTKVHEYTDDVLNGFKIETGYGSCFMYPCLYYWMIYFGALKLGNFCSLLFLFVNFSYEYLTMVVTLQCVIEIYVAEFKFAKRWITTLTIFVLSLTLYMLVYNERRVLNVLCKLAILILECVGIFALYPLRRLLDDLMFYYGTHPSKMRYLNLLLIPASELLLLVAAVVFVYYDLRRSNNLTIYIGLIAFMAVPLVAGIVYTFIKYLHFNQKLWTLIFCPVPAWGPNNFVARQLRKQLDSKEFIDSQAPRILSRYLMRNAQPETYKLDIVYEHSNVKPALVEDFEQLKKYE